MGSDDVLGLRSTGYSFQAPWRGFFLAMLAVAAANLAGAQQYTPANCSTMTLTECEHLVVGRLRAKPLMSPADAVRLVSTYWDPRFETAYLALTASDRAKPTDVEKLKAEAASRLNPIDYLRDKAIEDAVKRYMPRLAPILAAISSAPAEFLFILFWPSPTATPAQELGYANKRVQDELWKILRPYMKTDWESQYVRDIRIRIGPAFQQAVKIPPKP